MLKYCLIHPPDQLAPIGCPQALCTIDQKRRLTPPASLNSMRTSGCELGISRCLKKIWAKATNGGGSIATVKTVPLMLHVNVAAHEAREPSRSLPLFPSLV